jgi:hypothetical protein
MEHPEITYEDFAPSQHKTLIPTLKPYVETSIRDLSMRIYLHDSEDYDACCQIQIYGAKAWMHSITGAGFYLAINEILEKCRSMGIKELSGYVVPSHARLMKRMSKKAGVNFIVGDTDIMDGHHLTWVSWIL